MLPLSLLKSSIEHPILVELKNGETYNGKLSNIDLWMNVSMKQVVRTSRDGDQFWTMPEVYVRGNTIKYVRIPDTVLDTLAEEKHAREASRNRMRGSGRARPRGRGGMGARGDRDRNRDKDRDRDRDRDQDRDTGGRGGASKGRGYGRGHTAHKQHYQV